MVARTSYMVIGMEEMPVQDEVMQAEGYNPVEPQIITETVTLVAGGYGGVANIKSNPES